jgi:aspartyl-tRNA(Asn)/glutamyl-tRNA(Gln) amidotransferase subunit B
LPVEFKEQWLSDIRNRLCELPLKKQTRYVAEYKLSEYDAAVLTAERSTAEFFEQTVEAGGEAKRICNLLTQTGLKLTNERNCSIADLGISPANLAELAKMVNKGDVSATAANSIFEKMVQSGKGALELAKELNLIQKSDAGELEAMVIQVISANPQAVADVKEGGKKCEKARNFLLGQVMQRTRGRANPKVVSQILDEKLR